MNNRANIAEIPVAKRKESFSYVVWLIIAMKVVIVCYFVFWLATGDRNNGIQLDSTFFLFILAGFVAQIIDGALGMAYGVSCTSLLLSLGVPVKFASASVHTAEIFTTGVSGLSHIHFKNIDKKLFFKIVVTGAIGAMAGAYLLSDIFNGDVLKPYISAYLLILGLYILSKAFKKKQEQKPKTKYASVLAFFGGLFDAIGGGGWGPIVTSNLLSRGHSPRHTIGTVNTAEFFVTYFATVIFVFVLGIQHLDIVLALVIGGAIAAPFGAYLASKINQRLLLILVGILIVLTSGWGIINAWLL